MRADRQTQKNRHISIQYFAYLPARGDKEGSEMTTSWCMVNDVQAISSLDTFRLRAAFLSCSSQWFCRCVSVCLPVCLSRAGIASKLFMRYANEQTDRHRQTDTLIAIQYFARKAVRWRHLGAWSPMSKLLVRWTLSQALLCSIELRSIKCNLETAKIRRKTWQLLSRHCQNWNSHTSKIGYLLPVCHRNNSLLADDISQPHAKLCDIR